MHLLEQYAGFGAFPLGSPVTKKRRHHLQTSALGSVERALLYLTALRA